MNEDEDFVARIADAEAILFDPKMPPNIRAAAKRLVEWLREYHARPDSRADLLWVRDNKHPAWVRDPELVSRLFDSGAVTEDASGAVTVRWDLIAQSDRAATFSLLNEVVDGYRNRSVGGRPRK